MNTKLRSLRNASCSACSTLKEERRGARHARGDVAEHEDLGPARALGAVLQRDRHPAGLQRRAHRAPHVDVGVALATPQLMALGGQPALELGDDPVHGGEVLDRAARQRPVELVQRALGRQLGRALDQRALELAAQLLLEAAQLLARQALAARVVLGQVGLGLGAQPERAADALHVDAEHARALAAAEGGDGQAGEVAQRRLVAVAQRGGDLLAQGLEVEIAIPGMPRLPSVISWRAAWASTARKKKRSKTSSNTRRSSGDLASVAARASLKSVRCVQGTCSSAWKVSRISEVPIATPSPRRSSAKASSSALKPPGRARRDRLVAGRARPRVGHRAA